VGITGPVSYRQRNMESISISANALITDLMGFYEKIQDGLADLFWVIGGYGVDLFWTRCLKPTFSSHTGLNPHQHAALSGICPQCMSQGCWTRS